MSPIVRHSHGAWGWDPMGMAAAGRMLDPSRQGHYPCPEPQVSPFRTPGFGIFGNSPAPT